jgi:hypothetical protein
VTGKPWSHPDEGGDVLGKAESESLHGDEEVNRLWAHGLHEDNMFIQRGNFFLVAESMLLVAYAAVLASHARPGPYVLTASHIIAGFGLALTSVWILISHRHMTYLRLIQQRMYSRIHEYRETRSAWRNSQARWWRKVHTNMLLSYAVPGLAGVMWLLLLVLV